jgi:hypothetical protein
MYISKEADWISLNFRTIQLSMLCKEVYCFADSQGGKGEKNSTVKFFWSSRKYYSKEKDKTR